MRLNLSPSQWKEIRQVVKAAEGKAYRGKITNLLRNRRFNLESHLLAVPVMDRADMQFWGVEA